MIFKEICLTLLEVMVMRGYMEIYIWENAFLVIEGKVIQPQTYWHLERNNSLLLWD